MAKPRNHQSTAQAGNRNAGGFERLAKRMGHELITDDWRARIISAHSQNRKPVSFLGRPVLGSETVVEELKAKYPDTKFVTSTGRLTFNLMHRRLLDGRDDGEQLLEGMQQRVLDQFGDPIECETRPFAINRQKSSQEWGVKVPLVNDGYLKNELDLVSNFCKARSLRPTPQPLSIRIAEVISRPDAQVIAESAWKQLGDFVILGAPEILPVD